MGIGTRVCAGFVIRTATMCYRTTQTPVISNHETVSLMELPTPESHSILNTATNSKKHYGDRHKRAYSSSNNAALLSISPILKRHPHENHASSVYASSHHLFSSRTCASSSGEKSFAMLKVVRISSGDFPLIILAVVAQVRSSKGLISM